MNYKKELSKYGYNEGNSVPVETLIDEILPNIFFNQQKKYSIEDIELAIETAEWLGKYLPKKIKNNNLGFIEPEKVIKSLIDIAQIYIDMMISSYEIMPEKLDNNNLEFKNLYKNLPKVNMSKLSNSGHKSTFILGCDNVLINAFLTHSPTFSSYSFWALVLLMFPLQSYSLI